MAGYKRLGVYLNAEQVAECKRLAAEAAATPVITIVTGEADLAGQAWRRAQQMLHGYALGHGLPEIGGYYGADLATGEILMAEAVGFGG